MQPHYGFVVDIRLSETPESGTKETPYSEKLIDDSQVQKELKIPDEGWLTLGGEQRAAHFEVLKAASITKENNLDETKTGKLLYLTTPAYFKDGWRSEDKSNLLANPIAAAINRYLPIGGWYLNPGNANGESKYTRRCVPAGSTYFFDEPVTVTQPLTAYGWQIGYGIAYAGEW
jgi:CRISPR type III-B/RAMP module-associated protein Cmr3